MDELKDELSPTFAKNIDVLAMASQQMITELFNAANLCETEEDVYFLVDNLKEALFQQILIKKRESKHKNFLR